MTRTTFYNESLAASTTTGFDTKLVLSFTPEASTAYYCFWSCQFGNTTGTTSAFSTRVELEDNLQYEPLFMYGSRVSFDTSNRYSFFGVSPFTSSSPASALSLTHLFYNDDGDTITIQDARLLVLKKGADDADAIDNSESSTSSTSYQTKLTLTFTPPTSGDYLIFATATIGCRGTSDQAFVKMDIGGTAYGEMNYAPKNSNDDITWGTFAKVTLPASSQNITIQYCSALGLATASMQLARIVALRVSDFENAYYNEARTRTTTNSTSYIDKSTLTQTPTAGEHIIFNCQLADPDTTTDGLPAYQDFLEDSTVISENISNFGIVDSATGEPFFAAYRKTLTAASTTWANQWHSNDTSGDVGASQSAIAVMQTGSAPLPVSKTGTDAAALTITDTMTLLGSYTRSDTSSLTITDASSLLTILAVTDTGALSITDQAAILATVSRTDTAALTITDAPTGFVDFVLADAAVLTLTDMSSLTILLGLTDQFELTLNDTQELLVLRLISAVDSFDIGFDDQGVMEAYVNAADSFALSLNDQAAIFSAFVLSDALNLSFTDNQNLIAFLTRSDDITINFSDVVEFLALLSRADSATLSLDDAAAALVVKGVMDSFDLVATEAILLKVLLERMDTAGFEFRDQIRILANLDRSDSIGIQLADMATMTNFLVGVESLPAYRYDAGLLPYSDDYTLPRAAFDNILPVYEVNR